jgi:hypothetical protein
MTEPKPFLIELEEAYLEDLQKAACGHYGTRPTCSLLAAIPKIKSGPLGK